MTQAGALSGSVAVLRSQRQLHRQRQFAVKGRFVLFVAETQRRLHECFMWILASAPSNILK
jgi:hypothetical protein